MSILTVGLITYQHTHLKTEQVLQQLLQQSYKLKIYALPFTPRKPREVLFAHRPDQFSAIHPQVLAKAHSIQYNVCERDTEIDDSCDIYLILVANILSAECVTNKKIINCHPGFIPSVRGLDAFKWAVYEMKPLGVTLYYIDAEIDKGEIITEIPTYVYTTDSLTTLARRHYENEIDYLSRFEELLSDSLNIPADSLYAAEESPPRRRMPMRIERELIELFPEYIRRYAK